MSHLNSACAIITEASQGRAKIINFISFIHRKVEKERKIKNIYNTHKYSISNNMNKEKRSRKLVTKHSIKDQLWQQKYQNN